MHGGGFMAAKVYEQALLSRSEMCRFCKSKPGDMPKVDIAIDTIFFGGA